MKSQRKYEAKLEFQQEVGWGFELPWDGYGYFLEQDIGLIMLILSSLGWFRLANTSYTDKTKGTQENSTK